MNRAQEVDHVPDIRFILDSAMIITKVRFDGQTFLLDPEQSVDETRRAIVEAVRGGVSRCEGALRRARGQPPREKNEQH
jgi:hypothetical protein